MTQVLSICNHKGGVGKSTTTYHLARAAVRRGLSVLVIDADPQGNVSTTLAKEALAADQAGLADVLYGLLDSQRHPEDAPALEDVAWDGIWDGLTLIPTVGEALSFVANQLVVEGAGRESKLREALEAMDRAYDLVLIDCPPSLDQLTLNALTVSDGVVIITHARLWSVDGMDRLLKTIEKVRKAYNPALQIRGVLVNAYEKNQVGTRHWARQLEDEMNRRELPLLSAQVPKRVVIADTVESSQGLDEAGSDATDLVQIYDRVLTDLIGASK